MSLPKGVTYRHVATLFQRGYSVMGLARHYKCEEWEIQCAIRAVMNRAKVRR